MDGKYGMYALNRESFDLPESLTDYRVSSEDGTSYKISAKFSFDTPIGKVMQFLEAGGSVGFTRGGIHKRLILETDNGPKRS